MVQEHEAGATGTEQRNNGHFLLKLLIVVYMVAGLFLFALMTFDAWSGRLVIFGTAFLLPDSLRVSDLCHSFVFSCAGGGLGGIIFSILAFHRHVSVRQDFHQAHAWGFFLSPWVASILGAIVFALIQGGILVFASGAAPATGSETANLGYLGTGFLAGFGWNSVTEKLRQLIDQLFGRPADRSAMRREIRAALEELTSATEQTSTSSGVSREESSPDHTE